MYKSGSSVVEQYVIISEFTIQIHKLLGENALQKKYSGGYRFFLGGGGSQKLEPIKGKSTRKRCPPPP